MIVAGEPRTSEALQQAVPVAMPVAATGESLGRTMALIAAATFATTVANPLVIASLPFKYLLKDELGVGSIQMALFFAGAALAWYAKPLLGLAADRLLEGRSPAAPLAICCGIGAIGWLAMGILPHTYVALLLGALTLNITIAVASNLVGGLTVLAGQAQGATGRLNAAAMSSRHVGYLLVGPLGGYLAVRPMGITFGIGGAVMAAAAVAVALLWKAPASAPRYPAERFDWRRLFSSRPLLLCGLMIFLLQIAPGFETPLFFVQTNTLKFAPEFIGMLGLYAGVAGIAAGMSYGLLCRRFSPVAMLAVGIVADAAASAGFLFYRNETAAIALSIASGFATTLAFIPMMDIAARSTPRLIACGGFALMMSIRTITSHGSDVLGSWLFDTVHLTFRQLVWINSGTTLLALLALPTLAASVGKSREAAE